MCRWTKQEWLQWIAEHEDALEDYTIEEWYEWANNLNDDGSKKEGGGARCMAHEDADDNDGDRVEPESRLRGPSEGLGARFPAHGRGGGRSFCARPTPRQGGSARSALRDDARQVREQERVSGRRRR